jgi:hypothetical protein
MRECNITSFLTIKKTKIKLTVRIENNVSCKAYIYETSNTINTVELLNWQELQIKKSLLRHPF